MVIHTVQPGETTYSIAKAYGISPDRLLTDNNIYDLPLVVGESLVILHPKDIYPVQDGDTLEGIAVTNGVTVMELLRNNPQLSDRFYIYPGEELVIRFTDEKIYEISTNGYAFPFIDINILRKTLPFLTYLTIFYYRITRDGEIVDIDDQDIIDMAKAYGVAPIMLISTISTFGDIDVESTHNLITDKTIQDKLIRNVIDTLGAKGYYGLNIDVQNILEDDRQLYVEFIENITERVRQAGYYVSITLTPSTFLNGTDLIYQGPEYSILGELTDSTMLLSYEWGHAHSPKPALPISEVRDLLDYIVTQIPPDKINIGIPTMGYIWQVPFIPNYTIANVITHNSSLILANEVGAALQRDPASDSPYFSFTTDADYIVWFRDVRSIVTLLNLVVEYGLMGVGIWNTMQFATGLWILINAQYEIRRIE